MEYQVTARKWRPQSFGEVIGQEHVTRALTNAIESGKIPHAFLFSGPRGVGKTTTARILAKSLNCEEGISTVPCQHCASCEAITSGQSLDVQEIDGASNRGIDNIREIRDNVSYMALNSRFKIIIIDEVHMLTTEASNALLKTLEEPPEHVFFVLATTEPNKVLPTIRSRCQHYLFKRIPISTIVKQLEKICEREGISADAQGLYHIASAADGSMRDAETLFDQVVLYTDAKITSDAVTDIIGIPEEQIYFTVLDGILNGKTVDLLRAIRDYIEKFGDAKLFLKGFLAFLRNGLLVLQLKEAGDLLELPKSQLEVYRKAFEKFKISDIVLLIQMSTDLFKDFRGELNDRFVLELLIFRLMDYRNRIPLGEIHKQLRMLAGSSSPKKEKPLVGEIKKQVKLPPDPLHPQKWKKDLGVVLKETLSKSRVTKPMIAHFTRIEQTDSEVRVFLSVSASYEYLSEKKAEIQKEVQKQMGYPVKIDFFLEKSEKDSSISLAVPKKEAEKKKDNGKESDLEKGIKEMFS